MIAAPRIRAAGGQSRSNLRVALLASACHASALRVGSEEAVSWESESGSWTSRPVPNSHTCVRCCTFLVGPLPPLQVLFGGARCQFVVLPLILACMRFIALSACIAIVGTAAVWPTDSRAACTGASPQWNTTPDYQPVQFSGADLSEERRQVIAASICPLPTPPVQPVQPPSSRLLWPCFLAPPPSFMDGTATKGVLPACFDMFRWLSTPASLPFLWVFRSESLSSVVAHANIQSRFQQCLALDPTAQLRLSSRLRHLGNVPRRWPR